MLRIRLSLSLIALLFVPLPMFSAGQGPKGVPRPEKYELDRLVGNKLDYSVRVLSWKAPEPQTNNLLIYAVEPAQFNEKVMRRVAEHFSMPGDITPIPSERGGDIGFCIRQANTTNSAKYRVVSFSLVSGLFAFYSGDDGFRWDIANHCPLMRGVPEKEEAKLKALEFLPLLGLSTNDLDHYNNGRLRWASGVSDIGYTDRVDKQRKKSVMARNVSFYQKMAGGGVTAGVGDGGELRFSFISDGKVASIEWFFRRLVKVGEARSRTTKEITHEISNRNAWTWHQSTPTSISVTNCVLAYPQGNSWLNQKYVWPFYMLTGVGSAGRNVILYVPLEW